MNAELRFCGGCLAQRPRSGWSTQPLKTAATAKPSKPTQPTPSGGKSPQSPPARHQATSPPSQQQQPKSPTGYKPYTPPPPPPPFPPATHATSMPQTMNVGSPGGGQGPQTINVYVTSPQYGAAPPQDSSTFAWLTLACYFFCLPIAMIMNVIGLISGPKRGCFLAMFLLLLVPYTLLIVGLIIAAATGALDEVIRELEKQG